MTRTTEPVIEVPDREIAADRGDAGVRVDRALLRHLADVPGLSRTRVQRWIAGGSVLINGAPPNRPAWRLAAGDQIRVRLPAVRTRTIPAAESQPLDIIHEDDDVLVVNKPAGLVVHPSYRNMTGTLLNRLLWHARDWPADAGGPGLVQRLDKQTSGLLLVAKRREIHAALQRAMHRDEVAKEYLAVVVGRPSPARGTIDMALDRDPCDRRRVVVRSRGGQPSLTRYERLGTSKAALSVLRCRLVTGRTHQIRVHLAARGWPIAGDATYGRRALEAAIADGAVREAVSALGRQALHAWRLRFNHPSTGTPLCLTAPPPADIMRLLEVAELCRAIDRA